MRKITIPIVVVLAAIDRFEMSFDGNKLSYTEWYDEEKPDIDQTIQLASTVYPQSRMNKISDNGIKIDEVCDIDIALRVILSEFITQAHLREIIDEELYLKVMVELTKPKSSVMHLQSHPAPSNLEI